jgi:hypothetical protein
VLATRRRIRGVVLLSAIAGVCAMAAPAVASAHTYSVVVSPSSAAAGARVAFKATFTNKASDVKLGSANLTAPSGFTIVSASVPVGSATTAGNVVKLRNLFLQPGKSVTATVVADVPCTAGDKTWSVVARKTGDFTGPDSGPRVNSQLTTTVTGGGCATALRFVNQPANARINETITTSPYNMPPGAAVTVEVVDGAGHRVTTSSAVVAVSIAPGTGNGTLHGTTTATAVNGVATFSDLSIDLAGTSYALRASSSGLTSATSGTFRIDEAATVCKENVDCTATLSDADASLSATAAGNGQSDSGVLVVNRGGGLNCSGYEELLQQDFIVEFLPTNADMLGRAKTISLAISASAMKDATDNGVAHVNVCFGAPFNTFAVKPGTPPIQNPAPGLFVGLLPDCGAPPCVSKRKGNGGGALIELRAPGGNEDPRYSG